MHTADFNYDLPPELIAQTPAEPRDSSRLLVLDRRSGIIEHAVFREIGEYLRSGDLLVLNETRVIPARLFGKKLPGGGKVEVLLLHRVDPITWEVLVGGSGMRRGRQIQIEGGPQGEVLEVMEGSRRLIRFDQALEGSFASAGHVPLPPYIHTPLTNPERYQTVYSRLEGSAAAPTAGLHFTPRLLDELKSRGVDFAFVTLHVGLDTFAPVTEVRPEEHQIHTEWCSLPEEAADKINQTRASGGRVIAVGTTSVRTLESAGLDKDGLVQPYEGQTSLYILPGYSFQVVQAIVTNFHLPKSTLIMLVSAFAGRESILNAYQAAKTEGYQFYSFGDAMLIL
jgi:S-adenosylmethionine:tRNA ribosyltransferase-isomerase